MAGQVGPAFGRVAILGPGLLGASVAAALRSRARVAGISGYAPVRTDGVASDAERALALGYLDRVAGSVAEAVAGADVVVLAAPVTANIDLIDTLAGLAQSGVLKPEALVTDLSSVKAAVVARAHAVLRPVHGGFVSSHPIAGGTRSGPEAARADLFVGREVVLSPAAPQPRAGDDPRHEEGAVTPWAACGVARLWGAVGASVRWMPADAHDQVYAAVSHWPHAVAFATARMVEQTLARLRARVAAQAAGAGAMGAEAHTDGVGRDFQPDDFPPDEALVGPGLRDLTRIAASGPELWADILLANRTASLDSARMLRAELQAIESALERADRPALEALFRPAARWRTALDQGR